MARATERVFLRLTGSEAERGLPLANLALFVTELRRALRDFARSRRAERTGRGGHPSQREELVTAFRLVEFKPGSALATLEPISPEADQEALADVEPLAVENLHALMDALNTPEDPIDMAVVDAIESARRSLGNDGALEIRLKARQRGQRRVVIDEKRVAQLERRVRRYRAQVMRISGRLHMVDLEPDRVGIRAADGVEWICEYPDELEPIVLELVGRHVSASGVGQLQTAARGSLQIEEVAPVDEFEQTPLFTFERVPIDELLREQGVSAPRGPVSILPDDLSDEDAERYLAAIIDEH